jgi:alkyl hydroperoxide reductase subunit AhpC
MLKIGKKAPDFTLESTAGSISLKNYVGKWVVLFFYPLDFTPV